jgi:hypothetical protein
MTRRGRSPRECSGMAVRPYPWSWDDMAGRPVAGRRNAARGREGRIRAIECEQKVPSRLALRRARHASDTAAVVVGRPERYE